MCKPIEVDELMMTQHEVKLLKEKVLELEEEAMTLTYKIGALNDVARMNVAGQIIAAMVTKSNLVTDNYIAKSVTVADRLVSHYSDMMQTKSETHYAMVKEMEDKRTAKEQKELEAEINIGELEPVEETDDENQGEVEH